MTDLQNKLMETIRDVPDFPKPGILFKDITPVLSDAALMSGIVRAFADRFRDDGITAVVGMESRGFIFGAPLAIELGCAFVPARKPGKLPYDHIGVDYALEYGTARLEMHTDAVGPDDRVLVVDDLLATGGTAAATNTLIKQFGATIVANCFVIELDFLNGRGALSGVPVSSLVHY
ncbi:MAG: adenine phosphoribosyltransferase [Myxococcota bacterium]|nr:adenine phosphoribosyltransferase [Myxococcota bacterium]